MGDEAKTTGAPLFLVGARVVTLCDAAGSSVATAVPRGSVGVVVRVPPDSTGEYRVRFPGGVEESFRQRDLTPLAKFKEGEIRPAEALAGRGDLFDRVILRCVVGSRAHGLADADSDVDRRGVFLPKAEDHWSLGGVPEQIECHESQETYWELEKFLTLALKANPNVLECLYSPIVETATPLGGELLELRPAFLSRLVYQTFNGYVVSQFGKMRADLRNRGEVRWRHAAHLIRLLLAGAATLREGVVPVDASGHRDRLLAVKRGEVAWEEVDRWRLALHADFDRARETTTLPERPDHEAVNRFLVKARRAALEEGLP